MRDEDKRRCGTYKNPNLNAISNLLSKRLSSESVRLPEGVTFGDINQPFYLTLDKPNTARTTIPVYYNDSPAGNIYVILFKPGDGTGDTKTYKTGMLDIPEDLKSKDSLFRNESKKILPRKKICAMEIFIPFFSIKGDLIYSGLASLEELTVDDVKNPTKVVRAYNLGRDKEAYKGILKMHPTASGYGARNSWDMQLTAGCKRDGSRFGDPHSVIHNVDEKVIQVVGFLSIEEKGTPLAAAFDSVELPEYLK